MTTPDNEKRRPPSGGATPGPHHYPLDPPALSPRFAVIYTGALMMLASIANDVLISSFGFIEIDLSLEMGQAGLIMSYFFLGSGLGQIVFGPSSDHVGRRPTIILCLLLFLIGTFVVYISNDLTTLLVGRMIQGIGCSVCYSVIRALLKDLYRDKELALQFARSFSVFALGPVLMPIIGVILLEYFPWRAGLAVQGVAGVLLLGLTIGYLPETLRVPRRRSAKLMIKSCVHYFRQRRSGYFTIPSIVSYTTLLMVLSHTPGFLITGQGLAPWMYAVIFSTCIGCAILPGQWVNRYLIRKYHIWNSLWILSMITIVGQSLVVIGVLYFGVGVWAIACGMLIFSFVALAQAGNFATLCIDPHPTIAGIVSSLHGLTTQFVGALVVLTILNPIIQHDPMRWIIVNLVISIVVGSLIRFGKRYID